MYSYGYGWVPKYVLQRTSVHCSYPHTLLLHCLPPSLPSPSPTTTAHSPHTRPPHLTHILSTPIPRPHPSTEANTLPNASCPAIPTPRVAANNVRSTRAAARRLVAADPEGGERAGGAAAKEVSSASEVNSSWKRKGVGSRKRVEVVAWKGKGNGDMGRHIDVPSGSVRPRVALANVVLAVCVGVEVYLAGGREGRGGGEEEGRGGEMHCCGWVRDVFVFVFVFA
jgi:hypothetical protein